MKLPYAAPFARGGAMKRSDEWIKHTRERIALALQDDSVNGWKCGFLRTSTPSSRLVSR